MNMNIASRPWRGPLSYGVAAAAVFFLISISCAAQSWCAEQSFELDLSELEKKAPAAEKPSRNTGRQVKKNVKKGAGKKHAAPAPPTAEDLRGEFVNYTIRPNDHIYKVLTTRFGLTSERAEALIPRILRVNGIRNIRGLRIGRTIRIPVLEGMSVPAASVKPAVPPATPAVPSSPGPSAAPATVAPPAPSPVEGAPEKTTAATPAPSTPAKGSKVIPRSVPAGEIAAVADGILEALSLQFKKSHSIDVPVGGSQGGVITIPTDRYFEYDGRRFCMDFRDAGAEGAMRSRILELSGYRHITLDPKDDFRSATGKILVALEVPSSYRKHTLVPASGDSGVLEVEGYLLKGRGTKGEHILLTVTPQDKALYGLIQAGEWDIQ
ncbi:MAG: hypothetical protein PHG20_03495 [Geobacteraceae bacterium]|nr:hypothetical protein [Geobacteraceae bacterium]